MNSPTEHRENIHEILDQVLETGKPVEMEWRGRMLRIIPIEPMDKFQRLTPRPDVIRGDPDALIHVEWNEMLR